jgi:hypothetical protein
MLSWLVRLILIVSGSVAALFVARDAVNFAVIQGVVALLLGIMVIFVAVFWPARWTQFLNGRANDR